MFSTDSTTLYKVVRSFDNQRLIRIHIVKFDLLRSIESNTELTFRNLFRYPINDYLTKTEKMKTNSIFLALLLVAFFALSSCNSRTNDNNDYNDTQDTTMQGDDTVLDDDDAMSPGVVLATVMAIDNNEINAAQEAQKKSLNQAVMDYAKMLESDHKDNLQKANSLAQSMNITSKESDDVEKLKKDGADMLSNLVTKDGEDFAKDYIDKMVKGHQDALDKIDNDLIPATTDSQLRDFLNQTRQAVANHLDRAKQLQDSM